jgi:fucose permease
MKKSHKIYAIVASFIVMFIMAVTESIRGVLIPSFKIEFGVSNTQIGTMVLLATLAYVVGTYLAGKLSRVMNQKQIVLIGMFISGLGFLGTSFAVVFWHLVLGYFVLTIGIGFVILGLNTIVPAIKVVYIGVIINTLHFFYGFGATVTQRVGGYLISNGVSWRQIFWAFAVLYVIGIVIYSFIDLPKKVKEEKHLEVIHQYEKPLIILFCIGLGFYIAAEIQTLNWFVNYLNEFYQYTENEASRYAALFFGMLAAGRLFGGYILEKIGYLKGILIALVLGLTSYSIGLINEQTLIMVSISGLFCSIVYPTSMLVIQRVFEHNAIRIVSIVSMAGSSVNMISGYLIGYLNDSVGVRTAYFLIPVYILLSLICFIAITIEMKRVEKHRLELGKVTV